MAVSLLALDCVKCWPICEIVAFAARTLWSRGSWLGGALVSALCCVALKLTDCGMAFSWFCFGWLMCAISILWMIQCYHLLNTFQFLLTDQLITTVSWLFVVLLGFVLVSVFCVSLGSVVVFVGFLVALHGDSSMDYVSIHPSTFWCTLSSWWCCHCINSGNLQIATGCPDW